MPMNRIATLAFSALLCATSAFAADEEEAEVVPPAVSVQQSKIVNKTPSKNANFAPLIDLIKVGLGDAGFTVVDEQDMADSLKEKDKAGVMDGMEGGTGEGQLKVPGYYIRASVIQYGFNEVESEDILTKVKKLQKSAMVEVTFFIVDARSARQIAQVKTKSRPVAVTATAVPGSVVRGNFEEQALQTASDSCINEMIQVLIRKTPKKFRPAGACGKVRMVRTKSNEVLVKFTPEKAEKVAEGDCFDVFKLEELKDEEDEEGDDEDDGDDEEPIIEEIYIGTVKVIAVQDNGLCRTTPVNVEKGRKFAKKQLVRPAKARPAASAQKPGSAPVPVSEPDSSDPF